MIDKIRQFFIVNCFIDNPVNSQLAINHLQLSTAVLLIEVARADHVFEQSELEAIFISLKSHFNLSDEALNELIELAQTHSEDATSLFEFTRRINDHYGAKDRVTIIAMLWEIAFADGLISKYEEYIIRKISDLLYVPHKTFIAEKLAARERLTL